MVCLPPARTRNAAATRDSILDAARVRFARHSFDDVGLRQIAGDAGVDAALISRYFGSKEDLFAAVLNACMAERDDLLEGPREKFGRRVADKVVFSRKQGAQLEGLHIILRSVGSARAQQVIRAQGRSCFFEPLVAFMSGPDAEVRAQLATGLMMGLSIGREVSGEFDLPPEQLEDLRDRLASVLQWLADNPEPQA